MSAINVNGTWRQVSSIKIKKGGVWADHTALYAKLEGAWHLIDLSAEPQDPAYHVWKAYADDADGSGISLDPEGKTHIGFATGKRTSDVDITDPTAFDWSLIKGEDGKDGEDGLDGADGEDGKDGADVDPAELDAIRDKQDAFASRANSLQDSIDAADEALGLAQDSLNSSINTLDERVDDALLDIEGNGAKLVSIENTTEDQATKLTALVASDGDNRTRISDLEEVTTTSASRLSSLGVWDGEGYSKIASLDKATADNASSIRSLETTSGDFTSRVTSLEETSATQATRLGEVETSAENAQNRVMVLETTTEEQARRISSVETDTEGVTSKVNTLEETSEDNASRLTNVETVASDAQSSADSANSKVSTVTNRVGTLEETSEDNASRLTNVETVASDAQDAAGDAQSSADSANSKVSTVTNRVGTLEETSEDNASRLTSVETVASTADSKADDAQSAADSANSKVSTVTNRVSTLETSDADSAKRISSLESSSYKNADYTANSADEFVASPDDPRTAITPSYIETLDNGIAISGLARYAITRDFFKVDPSRSYEIRIRVRQTVNSSNGELRFYTGVYAYDENMKEVPKPAGAPTNGLYTAANREFLDEGMGWREFSGTMSGTGVSYSTFRAGTRYVRLVVGTNLSSSGSPVTEVDFVEIRDVTDINESNSRIDTIEETTSNQASRITTVETSATTAISKANTAQSSANTAQDSADDAQSTANTGVSKANAAQSTANTGVSKANAAQSTANTSLSKANDAQETADAGVAKANDAQDDADKANNAIKTVTNRVGTLEETTEDSASRLSTVETRSTTALDNAAQAQSTANSGVSKANDAQDDADKANSAISSVTNRVGTLEETTEDSASRLSTVETKATTALTRAGDAQDDADTANSRVSTVSSKVSTLEETAEDNASRIETVNIEQGKAVASAIDTARAYTDSETGTLKAERVIKADANGKVSGIHLLAEGSGADAGGKMYFQADEIAIVPPNWNASSESDATQFPFYFSDDRKYMYLDEAVIKALSAETIDSGSLAVDGLTLLSKNLSMPAGTIQDHMIDPAFKDGLVRVNPDGEILGGTQTLNKKGIAYNSVFNVPPLVSGGSAQTLNISITGPNVSGLQDLSFDLTLKLNGVKHNFTSGDSTVSLSSAISATSVDGGQYTRYRTSFGYSDQIILPAPTKSKEYAYQLSVSNVNFNGAYDYADRLNISVTVSEPTISSGGFITDVNWEDVKGKPSGAGSGLDADKLDGLHASSFARTGVVEAFHSAVYFGGSRIMDSNAAVQIDGFIRTGTVFLHDDNGSSSDPSPSGAKKLENSSGSLMWGGGKVWHSGNDGSGSGLNADKIDGLHASVLARTDVSETFNKPLTIRTVGTALSIGGDSILSSADASIRLGNEAYYYDITYEGTGSGNLNAFVISSNDHELLRSNIDGIVNLPQPGAKVAGNTIWHTGNDGSGSGLDADKVDGVHASQLARTDIDETFNKSITIKKVGTALSIGGGSELDEADASIRLGNGSLYYDITYEGTGYANENAFVISSNDHEVLRSNLDGIVNLSQSGAKVAGNTIWHAGNDGNIAKTNTVETFNDAVYFGGGKIMSSAAVVQINGFSRVGSLFIHNDNGTTTAATTENFMLSYSGGYAKMGASLRAPDFIATSDRRVKSNIKPIENALEKVGQLTGNTYTRDDQNNIKSAGVIAQEVEAVLPELVREDEGTKQVAHNGLIGLLVEAVKELTAKVKKLEGRNNV